MLQKLDAFMIKAQNAAIIALVVIMVSMTLWQIVTRYFLHISAPYAEEFARLAIVWCIFIASSLAVRLDEHIQVDILIDKLPKGARLALRLLTHLLIMGFAVVMIVYGVHHYRMTANDMATSLGYGRNLFYLPVPVSGAIIFLYSIVAAWFRIKSYMKERGKA